MIRAIIEIIRDMWGFILILAVIIIGFSLIFFEFDREPGYPEQLLQAYNMLFSNFETEDLNLSQILLFLTIAFLLSVILLNLLIAIMGDTFDKVQEKRVLIDSRERLELVIEAICILRFFQSKKIQSKKGYLLFCQIFGDDEDEVMAEASEWEGKIALLRKVIKQSEKKLDDRFRKKSQPITNLLKKRLQPFLLKYFFSKVIRTSFKYKK